MKINLKISNGIILILLLFVQGVDFAQNKINSKNKEIHTINFRDVKEEVLKVKNNTFNYDENKFLSDASISEENLIQMPFNPALSHDGQTNKTNNLPAIYKIESMTSNFSIDAKRNSCDVKVIDKIKFSMQKLTDRLDYIVISKKTPLYGFTPKILSQDNSITGFEVFEDSSFKQRIYIDSDGRRITFRDRWLISLQFLNPVKDLEIHLEYFMQRAVLIDNIKESNYLKFSLINPNSFNIDNYQIVVNLLNFEKLKPEEINTPIDGMVKVNGNDNIKIVTSRKFDKHSEIEVFLSLPYELTSCDGNIVNFVFYGLVFTSVTFVILSLITIGFLYKE